MNIDKNKKPLSELSKVIIEREFIFTEEEDLECEIHFEIKSLISYEFLEEYKVIDSLEKNFQINFSLLKIFDNAKRLKKINSTLKVETVKEMIFCNLELTGEKTVLSEHLDDIWMNYYDSNKKFDNVNLDDNLLKKICNKTFKNINLYLKNKKYYPKSKGFG
ncbi:MAG: hypothetical protein QNJ54_26880 [Prochloraceae cyanobacterium]|nr:hypothetical protein [Prochloraceae cyanobacterium]